MAGFEIDTSELRKLSADLGRIPAKVVPEVESVLKKGADVLKKNMQAEFQESPHFKRVAEAVSYERRGFGRQIAYEVGPEMGRGAGSLGFIAVDGGANGGGGSVKIDQLLEPEAKQVEKFLGDILEDAL